MLKYINTKVTFAEVPNQISLCINISNCPCNCKGCHSSYLAEDIGNELNGNSIKELINNNKGITCICFMGGDSNPLEVNALAHFIKTYFPIKIAWYSGRQELSKDIELCNFDAIKLGGYNESLGPLNCPTTNQRFYKVVHTSAGTSKLYDITYKFWKHETED